MILFRKLRPEVQIDVIVFLNVTFWIVFVGLYLALTITDAR